MTTTQTRTPTRSVIEAWLSDAGLEMTPQTFAVLEHLTRGGPLPAEQLVAALTRRHPRPSREAISGTLKTLCDVRLVEWCGRATESYRVNPEYIARYALREPEDD